MDRYVVFLSDDKDTNFYAQKPFEFKSDCFSKTSLSHCISRTRNFYAFHILLSAEQSDQCELDEDMLQWRNLEDHAACTVSASPLLASEILFFLTDKFSDPGSFLLDIYWCFSNANCDGLSHLHPLLGALKKLKLWQQAEITVFNGFSEPSELSHLLQPISDFLLVKIIEISEPQLMDSTVWQNNRTFWRGLVNVELKDGVPISFSDFQLLQHCCHQDHEKPAVKFQSCTVQSNLWLGSSMSVVELVNLNTLPLFWYTGSVFILQCPSSNIAGIKFQEVLRKSKSSGILCRLAFVHTAQEFLPCQELSSKCWKNAVQNNSFELPSINKSMGKKRQNLNFVITPILNKNCAASQLLDGLLQFHAHELHLPSAVDLNTPAGDILYTNDNLSFTPSSSLAFPFEVFDKSFLNFFSRVLKIWKAKKLGAVLKGELQNFISESWLIYEHEFQSKVNNISEVEFLNCLFEKRRFINTKHNDRKSTVQSRRENDFDMNWSFDSKSLVNLKAADILNCFTGPTYKANVNALLQASGKCHDTPSLKSLTTFSSAVKLFYPGINFNLDAQHSEARDKYHRKRTENLIKYETQSIGSRDYVPTVISKNFGDTPVKLKKPVRKKIVHTPRKKKRIAKVAEKLYKLRRVSRGSKVSDNSAVAQTKKKVNFKVTSSKQKTSFTVTPTKKVTSSLVKCSPRTKASCKVTPTEKNCAAEKKALTSPGFDNAALHCTPTKSNRVYPASIKLTPQSKVAARKKRQKKYVRNNKQRLTKLILKELAANGITKERAGYEQCIKKLYRVSMAFLKDLTSSKDLENIMQRIVKENVRLVLSLESKQNSRNAVDM